MTFIKAEPAADVLLTAIFHKHLNDELKYCLLQFFPEVAQNSLSFPRSEKSLSIPGFSGLWPPWFLHRGQHYSHRCGGESDCTILSTSTPRNVSVNRAFCTALRASAEFQSIVNRWHTASPAAASSSCTKCTHTHTHALTTDIHSNNDGCVQT